MKNSAYIKRADEDDSLYKDLYEEYGVSFLKGSYLSLLSKAKAKDYVKNDSRLLDGVQYLATPATMKKADKNVSLTILMEGTDSDDFTSKYESFTDKISGGLIFLKVPSKKRVFKLVYSDIQIKQEYFQNKATFTLSMIEPNPEDRIIL